MRGYSVAYGKTNIFVILVLLLVTLGAVIFFQTATSRAATLTVNSTGDDADDTAGDGTCETANGNGVCTLRAAIEEANALAGTDIINFNISGSGVKTIVLGSALPSITEAVTIDGTTQTGASCGDLWAGTPPSLTILIQGGNFNGIVVTAGNSTIKGLDLEGFSSFADNDAAIVLTTADSNTVQCNVVKANSAGTSDGVYITSSSNTIGGSIAGQGNHIAGNGGNGVLIDGGASNVIRGNFIGTNALGTTLDSNNADAVYVRDGAGSGSNIIGGTASGAGNLLVTHDASILELKEDSNVVQGNYFGVDRLGTSALGSPTSSISLFSNLNTIGGTASGARNIIGAGGLAAIALIASSDNVVQGNYIGVGSDGVTATGAAYGVVFLGTAINNTIGGQTEGAGNVIANITNAGITTYDAASLGAGEVGTGNAFLGNSIHSNGELGIDLANSNGPAGVTANDAADSDSGPNNFQNFPVLSQAVTNGSATTVSGSLSSTASASFIIEFFSNATGDASGNGEGQTYLGTTTATTNGSGAASFTVDDLPATTIGHKITATASRDHGGYYSTSEFAANVTVAASNTAPTITDGPSDGGSSDSARTDQGRVITFNATATDAQSDQYYLAICKTNSVTAGSNAAPTCGGGSWAISSATSSGTSANASYTTTSDDVGSKEWFAFVCDKTSSSPDCSASSQGSGVNGSPFVVTKTSGSTGGFTFSPPVTVLPPSTEIPIQTPTPPSEVPDANEGGHESDTEVPVPPSAPLTPTPPSVFGGGLESRDIGFEQAVLGMFGNLFGYLPTTDIQWRVFNMLIYTPYGRPTEAPRDLTIEQHGLVWFTRQFFRLPIGSDDWKLLNAWAYGTFSQ